MTTVPLTLLTLACLVATWHAPAGVRLWSMGAALAALRAFEEMHAARGAVRPT